MSPRITTATAGRVLRQLRADPRTVALLLVVPSALVCLLRWLYDGAPATFERIGLPLLGVFPFVTMFLVTSVAMLRERTSGTLERLLTTRLSKLDLLLGYALAFAVAALAQAGLAVAVAVGALGLAAPGGVGWLLVVAVASALLGTATGLLASAFARTEFQAVQFMPALVLPQFLLSGLLVPRQAMSGLLRALSDVMPLSYAVDGMVRVGRGPADAALASDLAVVAGCAVAALVLGAATLRRRTA